MLTVVYGSRSIKGCCRVILYSDRVEISRAVASDTTAVEFHHQYFELWILAEDGIEAEIKNRDQNGLFTVLIRSYDTVGTSLGIFGTSLYH